MNKDNIQRQYINYEYWMSKNAPVRRLRQTSIVGATKMMNTQRKWIKCVPPRSALRKTNKGNNVIDKLCSGQATKTWKWKFSNKPEFVHIAWNIVIYQDNIMAFHGFRTANILPSTLSAIHYLTLMWSIWWKKTEHSDAN